jgi:hypothetical protein
MPQNSPYIVEGLKPTTGKDDISRAISESIAQCMESGERSQEQCEAIVHDMARKAQGGASGGPALRKIRSELGD